MNRRATIKAVIRNLSRLPSHRRSVAFRNREGLSEYDFTLSPRHARKGVTAMLRVRNEQAKVLACVGSMVHLFDEIIFVDNASTDATLGLVRDFKDCYDSRGVIAIHQYPHEVARYGEEHWHTPDDSIHSLAYYYNWCLSRCTCRYVLKWDADMVVAAGMAPTFRTLLDRVCRPRVIPTLWSLPIQTVYRSMDGPWYLAQGEINEEPRLFPNRAPVRYRKARHWEELWWDVDVRRETFEPVCIYELKDVAEDEFSHWTPGAEFPSERKRREWEHFNLVKSGAATQAGSVFRQLEERFIEVAPGIATAPIGQVMV